MMALLLPDITPLAGQRPDDAEELSRRLADALRPKDAAEREADEQEEKQEIDAALTFSSKEILQSIDFEKMSAAELAAAKQAIQAMRLPIMEVPTRRFRAGGSTRRAEERRVGKGCVGTCRYRGMPYH